ncbi:hypothetical protein [Streptomyces cucumeris]|uniref:hypothetical protein n=1 Tax=Streptomyces cucumeris TaxID=2962890 RepID=UPI003D707733
MINREETLSFVLSGPAPARDTVAGWQHWIRTRNSFAPAPVMDRAAFGLLSKRKKMLHNLRRTATHANLPLLDTPMSLAVEKLLTGRIETNALKIKPTTRAGVMLSGGGYQGKTNASARSPPLSRNGGSFSTTTSTPMPARAAVTCTSRSPTSRPR